MRQRMADDFGLLMDFLRHEMAVVALVDQKRRGGRLDDGALHRRTLLIVNFRALAVDDDPVAILEIAHRVGERRQRNRVGAEKHFAVAVAHRQGRTAPRADQQIFLAVEQECQSKRALEAWQRGGNRILRR